MRTPLLELLPVSEVQPSLFLLDAYGPISSGVLSDQIPTTPAPSIVCLSQFAGAIQTSLDRSEPRWRWARLAEATHILALELRAALAANAGETYVYGQAPLPVFVQLGFEVSAWSDGRLTLLNQRKDKQWDRFPLATLPDPKPDGAAYFRVAGLPGAAAAGLDERAWPGRVAVFISTREIAAPVDAIRSYCTAAGQEERPIGLVSLITSRPFETGCARQVIEELSELFSAQIPAAFPKQTGLALFLAGPASLAYFVGRAINPKLYASVWVPDFQQGSYREGLKLPYHGVAPRWGEDAAVATPERPLIPRLPGIVGGEPHPAAPAGPPLSALHIEVYRRLADVHLRELKRFNLLVGGNNSGKTSVLEACHLLVAQSDTRGLHEVLRLRGRWADALPEWWALANIPAAVIRGERDGREVALRMKKGEFAVTGMESALCRTACSLPFVTGADEQLRLWNEESLRLGSKAAVLRFLRERVSPGLLDIELVEGRRFMISHEDPQQSGLDLTALGDGAQRVFRIGLLFAAVAGGVALIDEIDSGVHASLLDDFIALVQELAVQFNVQVLASTHSRECVDAFLANRSHCEELVCYTLVVGDGGQGRARRFSGAELNELVAFAGIDVRRAK